MWKEYGFTSTISKYTKMSYKTCMDHAFLNVKNRNLKEICETYVLDSNISMTTAVVH